jgi:CMP/dCMP kinase
MSAVAIDGPAGAGKSTVARRVAARLGYTYVDTGAMYRALALAALEREVEDASDLAELARTLDLRAEGSTVTLDGVDVTERIRGADVTERVSLVAAEPDVRFALVARQQEAARRQDVVMEGRDIGSAVLPDAEVKVFLTASLEERARRRAAETGVPEDQVMRSIEARDRADSRRAASPLVRAADAVEIDTTGRTIDEVVDEIVELARASDGVARGAQRDD